MYAYTFYVISSNITSIVFKNNETVKISIIKTLYKALTRIHGFSSGP